jgi:beta-glucosidase
MSSLVRTILVAALLLPSLSEAQQSTQPVLTHRSAPILTVDGLQFKDLNRDGKLDPYEDWRLSSQRRAEDLVSRMTLSEKAGLMMHGAIVLLRNAKPAAYDPIAMEKLILDTHVNSFITRLGGEATHLAEQDNLVQEIAERDRLGIPVTISTDPRNHFQFIQGASAEHGSFSLWPETLGLAALHDPSAIRRFGDIARQEYLAVGINEALSPQADLPTEPRWARINGTFGEDAELTKESVKAYIEGFQNGDTGIHPGSVIAVVKHWVGYGAQVDGLDSHNSYGRFAAYPGKNFPYHLKPYEGAFAAHVGAVMPTYSILQGVTIDGKKVEPVGANYSHVLLTDLLRGDYHFQGVILTDWGVTEDCVNFCLNGTPPGTPATWEGFGTDWGVESLTKEERFAKAIEAGVDQFGGTEEAQWVVAAVKDGKVTEARVDESVTRILVQKFALGLFENPYVDPTAAEKVAGNKEFQQAADEAQRHSLVLLQNKNKLLPIRTSGKKVFLVNIDPGIASKHGFTVVDSLEKADVAIIRTTAPYQTLHPGYAMGHMQHEGDLDFKADNPDLLAIQRAAAILPTIVTVYLDRPAILTNVVDKTSALLGNFGVSDEAFFDVITGKDKPLGRLPFELPSSMNDVLAQKSDLPHDTAHPLFAYGFGLEY